MSTDRAKRYAANRDIGLSLYERRSNGCLFCGSRTNLTVDHLDGIEDHGEDANLVYLCKSCNTRKGAAFRKAGIGRLTHQFNPNLGLSPAERRNFEQLGFEFAPSPRARAARVAREVSGEDRRRKAARLAALNERRTLKRRAEAQALYDSGRRMNPGKPLTSPVQWSAAVRAVLGEPSTMSVPVAASRIRATAPGQRRKLAAAMKPNPGKVPTYAQYAWAVSTHCAGRKKEFHGDTHGCGEHDEGGAIIHATPPEVRRRYARIMDSRRKARERAGGKYDEVPF
jgi:hypothetical protein